MHRSMSDAEKRIHEAAKNGECDDIRALTAAGTNVNCVDPDTVRTQILILHE